MYSKFPRYPTNTISYIVLYYNRFIILFTQTIHEKTNKKLKKTLPLQYSTLKRAVLPATSPLLLGFIMDILGLK